MPDSIPQIRANVKQIQMVDLKTQYCEIKADIDSGIRSVIDSAAFVKGQVVTDFQDELARYLGVKHVIAVGNGTDALQIALMTLGLRPGDEVITPTFTFIATAEVAALMGFTPVLVDVDYGTFNIRPDAVRRAITPRTKAIVPVHLFGQCADMDAILEIAREHRLYVVEDACQAIGAEYTFKDGTTRKAGCMGQLGCTSFFPSKNLGCYGDGGAIFTDDDALAAKARAIANHGMTVRYHHDLIGVNSRLDSIQAAVLRAKLPHLNEYTAARQAAAAAYDAAFRNHPRLLIPERLPESTHVFHQYTLRIVPPEGQEPAAYRDSLREKLSARGIPAMVYYPVPLHMQKAYLDPRYREGDFPTAEQLASCVLSLPMHTCLDKEQLSFITSSLLELIG